VTPTPFWRCERHQRHSGVASDKRRFGVASDTRRCFGACLDLFVDSIVNVPSISRTP